MTLRQQGNSSYGNSQQDIQTKLIDYSRKNGYLASHFAEAVCKCESRNFGLFIDDTAGAAVRVCLACSEKHPIGDSDEYLAEAKLEECECPCGKGVFEITVGVALYQDTQDVRLGVVVRVVV